ncbi:hypothetical protein MQC88_05845 [Luteimonas sp. 50]|uniref:DUF4124 domain-containing protein n=1 Tax=Cognatiluteimonas sedimenti TaxID=2927791 RepID=A0ABT0A3D1_9GAMM|nr:hypothetical protein [Lysobacter sedimenti]MCJ0825484.1 hypothetical protein [Lysobacter sedimenti]
MTRASWVALLLTLLLLAVAGSTQAQVRRCTATNGTTVFTDRRCQDIGAVDHVPSATAGLGARPYRNACARTLQDLVYELTSAIDDRDVNRLAGVYQWTGVSTGTGYALMQRLDAIAQRPLVDIVPVYPAGPGDEDDYYPQATVRRRPIGLRLEQTLANGSTPSRTVLGLRRSFGCWWVSL